MTAPQSPGRYVSFWKLADADGVRFGQRVWADICVVAENDEEPKSETLPMETSLDESELENQVKQLSDMGFSDLEENKRVLEKHKLDMVKTVQELLNK